VKTNKIIAFVALFIIASTQQGCVIKIMANGNEAGDRILNTTTDVHQEITESNPNVTHQVIYYRDTTLHTSSKRRINKKRKIKRRTPRKIKKKREIQSPYRNRPKRKVKRRQSDKRLKSSNRKTVTNIKKKEKKDKK